MAKVDQLYSNKKTSYSGADFNIWAYYPITEVYEGSSSFGDLTVAYPEELELIRGKRIDVDNYRYLEARLGKKSMDMFDIQVDSTRDGIVPFANMQTITSSFASSLSAVENIGSSLPVDHTRGQKTFAGSIIFTVLDKEPLREMIEHSYLSSRDDKDMRPEYFTVDQIPAFNVVIQGSNEVPNQNGIPQQVIKVLVGVKLMTHGETISIDDFFLEQTYQYVCRYVSPWITTADNEAATINSVSKLQDLAKVQTNKGFNLTEKPDPLKSFI
jgi:hypothetical protein